MKGKVATITLNPAYDLVGMLDSIEKGAVNLVKTHGLYPAGKGINVANTLKNLNVNVTVGGFLGKENLNGFLHDFKERGITNRFHAIEGRTRINVKLTEKNRVVSDFNFSGFEVNKQDWQHFARDSLSWLSQFDMVCVSGSLPKGIDLDDFTNWMKRLRNQCMCVIFDSSRDALIAGLKANPWLVKPNRHELESWIGHPLPTYQEIAKAAQQLRSQGIAHVVISLGEEGAMWVNASGVWLATPPKCQVVSTVGAGDAMVGGLIYGLLMRQTSEHTLRLATAISAITVSQGNVRSMDRQQLTKMMNQVALIPYQI
ncbi:1-phosphofructokinase [Arsenophonus nasoniae]|uniref:Phosphofructokinase n=2 Tax=Arsenophonus nasoniae TaxID=638 RepID=A0A4P7KQ26_9GAMM|nr:1-phosphofructokinase [Arsenophonus nasoniae]QBY41971.1 Tagatose-6-phosphate kinase [Arsenophonus nasoniae]WGM06167.1 1-phosphofructokinase [Arsenophonus nasoniae]WGM11131.1 1-phosphofructokinase [Arsenophonus nasoniae]WGM15831.1 1-phosphofructokinase [Arsenophonus nasoniae]